MGEFYRSPCYNKVCEKCENKIEKSGLFGKKYKCKLNQKPVENKCFYVRCMGKENSSQCLTCSKWYKRDDVKE